jgi:hypothetical protein
MFCSWMNDVQLGSKMNSSVEFPRGEVWEMNVHVLGSLEELQNAERSREGG